jgi:hypothetical protein
MKNSIDLERLKRLRRTLAGNQIKNADPNDPFAREIYVFAFKGKFHQIESGNHKVVKEPEVKALLDKNPETKLYYICTNEGMCPLPGVYVGRGAKAVQLKDDQAVIDYIKQITGVQLAIKDL